LLYVPFIEIEKSQKNYKNTWKEAYDKQIEKIIEEKKDFLNFHIQTTLLENCDDEWINLEEYAANLASSEDYSI
jgi:hypothetical protein